MTRENTIAVGRSVGDTSSGRVCGKNTSSGRVCGETTAVGGSVGETPAVDGSGGNKMLHSISFLSGGLGLRPKVMYVKVRGSALLEATP